MIIDILNKALEAEGKGRAAMFDMDFPENYTLVPEASVSEKEWIDNKYDEFLAEYDAQEYARKRQAEYPSIEELVVALYDTDDKSAIEAKRAEVKKKYPKPS